MARATAEPSAKRAKVGEADEEEDPLVLRKEELVLAAKEARSRKDAHAERVARRDLLSLCADFEAKNENLLNCLPPELWSKIVDEILHQNDELALAMTCRFFREKHKELGKKLETNLDKSRLDELQKSGKIASHSLGWFQWVCDTFEILPGFKWYGERAMDDKERVKGAVYDGVLLNYAAFQGSVEILRWLTEEKGWELNEHTGLWAGKGGCVEVLKYLRGRGYYLGTGTCSWAASRGCFEALKFLRGLDPPCLWDEWTCSGAAKRGHLELLKWLRLDQDPPCPWDEHTCFYAAEGGHLEVLKFVRGQDPPCPWGVRTCADAAKEGHLEVLKWARSQDPPCPWIRWGCRNVASYHGHQHIVEWIDQQEDESDVEY